MQENYRGYNKEDNQWYYGDLIGENIIVSYFEIGELLPEEALTLCKCVCHIVDKESVGRFTGKYDIIRNPIYQGDILECFFHDYDRIGRFFNKIELPKSINGVVLYRPCTFYLELQENNMGIVGCELGWSHEEFEILGNKTNNPELMNKKQN